MRTRAKICGLTRTEDVAAAVEAGADAIGLVFYTPSPRHVDIEHAAKLAKSAPAFVTVVGLFVNASEADVNSVIDKVDIDLLQFHGDESEAFCRSFNRPYIKAVRVASAKDITQADREFSTARALLLDTYVEGTPGGTGESFDWSMIPADTKRPLILAGGLNPENVATAIKTVKPYAVDVSGGVESAKGIKDHDKIRAFMKEVGSFVTG
ncbi:MAG: phosphoribosylanthranilate isomerase [Gammaproteobacteria bacterium]|nr:phosphoribosylanthranilate isomerase [Gammaproteobacteria bacterium]MDH5776904.1 phosphoribosylanthranilate isomerase [Gammaproteobacteria bacterium]